MKVGDGTTSRGTGCLNWARPDLLGASSCSQEECGPISVLVAEGAKARCGISVVEDSFF
jgi:hypothetical protein